ncbi:MOB kinase activator family protein [Kipferlia bialata]|uniref:MOB kinase activator family protein n=1 Tax=Kipferlia bialata TaxID=797122 RepID=A0A9K3DAH8_9EUKA|nr:MOB kinase activator family protein [Kipferlia bialata]|eukprot:g13031.t1
MSAPPFMLDQGLRKSEAVSLYPASCYDETGVIIPRHIRGSFPLQEYICDLAAKHPEDIERLMSLPNMYDPKQWKLVFVYEHLRLVTSQLSGLVSALADVCDSVRCPTMRVTQVWIHTYVY